MATVTVRNLPGEVHRALRLRAATHGRSTEAEIREILATAVSPPGRLRMGSALAELGRRVGLTDAEHLLVERARRSAPAEPMDLS